MRLTIVAVALLIAAIAAFRMSVMAVGVVHATADDRAALRVDLTGSNGEANEVDDRFEIERRLLAD